MSANLITDFSQFSDEELHAFIVDLEEKGIDPLPLELGVNPSDLLLGTDGEQHRVPSQADGLPPLLKGTHEAPTNPINRKDSYDVPPLSEATNNSGAGAYRNGTEQHTAYHMQSQTFRQQSYQQQRGQPYANQHEAYTHDSRGHLQSALPSTSQVDHNGPTERNTQQGVYHPANGPATGNFPAQAQHQRKVSGSRIEAPSQISHTLPSTFFGSRHQRLSQAGAYTNVRPETFFAGELQPYSPLYLSLMPGGSYYEKLITWCHTWAPAIGVYCGPNHPWRVVDIDIIVEEIRLMHRPNFKHPFRRDWNAHLLPASQNLPSGTAQPAPTAVMVPSTGRGTVNRGATPATAFPGNPSPLRPLEGSEVQRQAETPATPTLVSSDGLNQQTSSPEEAQPKTPSPPKNVKMPRPPVKDVRKMAEERHQKLQECRRDPTGAKLWEHARFGMRDLEQNGVRSVPKIVGDPNSVPLEIPFDYAAHEEAQRQAFISQQAREAQQALQIQQQQRQLPSKKRGYQENVGDIAAGQKRQKRSMKASSAIENGAVRMSRAPSGTSQKSAHVDLTTPPPPSRLPDPALLSGSASGWPEDLPRMPLDVYGVQGVELATLNRSIDSPDLPTVAKLFKDPVDPAAREIIETLWYIQRHAHRENENGRSGPITIRESAKRLIDFFDNHKTRETTQGADLPQTTSHAETNGSRFGSSAPPPQVASSKSTHTLSSNAPKAGEIEGSSSGQSRQKLVPISGSSKGQRKEQVLPPRQLSATQPVGILPAYMNQATPMSRKRSAEAMESNAKRTKTDGDLAANRIAVKDFAINPPRTNPIGEAPSVAPTTAAAGINTGAADPQQEEGVHDQAISPDVQSSSAGEEMENEAPFDELEADLQREMAAPPNAEGSEQIDEPPADELNGGGSWEDFDELFDEMPEGDAGADGGALEL